MLSITTAQAQDLLTFWLPRQEIPLYAGPPGCGKSAMIEEVATVHLPRITGHPWKCYIFHPATHDPTYYGGFPWLWTDPETKQPHAQLITMSEFGDLVDTDEHIVAFFDDFGHAPKSVQATLMQPFHARRLNRKRIGPNVSFAVATNRRGDKAGVEGVIAPILSRCRVCDIRPDLDSFLHRYWYPNNRPEEVAGYLRFRPDHLYLEKKTSDIENTPCYRTWDMVGRDLRGGIPYGLELPTYAASVGEGVAGEFNTYLRVYKEMPDPDYDIAHPTKAKVPENLSVLHAWCTALAYRTTVETFPAIAQLITKVSKSGPHGREEIAISLFSDAGKRCPQIVGLPACDELANGPLGELTLPSLS